MPNIRDRLTAGLEGMRSLITRWIADDSMSGGGGHALSVYVEGGALDSGASESPSEVTVVNEASDPVPITAPSAIPVSGTVEVTNDAGNPLPVSGTLEITNDAGNPIPVSGTMEITNDVGNPIPVTGNVAITGTPSVSVTGTANVAGTVAVSGVSGTVTVAGSVAVSAVGGTVAVAGTVAVSSIGGTVATLEAVPSTLLDGTRSATTTAAALGASTACKEVLIQAASTNTAIVYIGNATSQSIELQAGQHETIAIDNLSKIYVRAASGTQAINWHGSV